MMSTVRNQISDARLRLIAAGGLVTGGVLGFLGSLLFAVVAVQIFMGNPLTPLAEPLPFFAYPFVAATLFGWAWVHISDAA